LQSFGLKPTIDEERLRRLPAPKTEESAHVTALTVSSSQRLLGGEPLLKDKYGAFITEVRYGAGRILIGIDSQFCTNKSLGSKANFDNFQIMVNWLSTTPGLVLFVLFDERCHGYSGATNLFVFLLHSPVGLVFYQLLLILILAIASAAQRFGDLKHLQSKREMSALQFIHGLANAYQRAGANLAALEIIVQDFRIKLCKQLSISPKSSPYEIASSWKNLPGSHSSNLESFLTNYEQALNRKKISNSELKQFVFKCDELTKQAHTLFQRGSQP